MTTETIDLRKGASINLGKAAPGVHVFRIGLGWNAVHKPGMNEADLDASAFLCKNNANGDPELLTPATNIVFYGNKTSAEGAVIHGGDNRTGDGDGDDEVIIVDVSKLDPRVDQIIFAVTSYIEAGEHKYTFGEINKAYIRCLDDAAHTAWEQAVLNDPTLPEPVLAVYKLSDDYGADTAIQFGSLYKTDEGEWRFKALGVGAVAELADFVHLLAPSVQTVGA
jgi:tellurium resistance protein TerD